MSQHADGGVLGTKPYAGSAITSTACATIAVIAGMIRVSPGEDACPFTTLYWDFLARHSERFRGNRRMTFPYRNLARKERREVNAIRRQADVLKARLTAETFLEP